MLGSTLNQGAQSIWIHSTMKKEQSEENHYGKEEGMEDEEAFSIQSGFYVVFFLLQMALRGIWQLSCCVGRITFNLNVWISSLQVL